MPHRRTTWTRHRPTDRVAERRFGRGPAAGQRPGGRREQARPPWPPPRAALRQAESGVAAQVGRLQRAEAQLAAAKSAPKQVAQSRSQTNGATADTARAEAEVKQAELESLLHQDLRPVSGHVTRKSVEPGAYVQVGQPLLALVDPNVWVVANFKETQLDHMRPGQPVTVKVDTYPGVKFAAHVDSIQRGSGARFSLCRRRTPPATTSRSCSACR